MVETTQKEEVLPATTTVPKQDGSEAVAISKDN